MPGRLRMQVCPHWQNLSSCDEKLGLTKQINKGGVATCFTAGTNKGWLMTQPIVKEFSLQRTPDTPHLSEGSIPCSRQADVPQNFSRKPPAPEAAAWLLLTFRLRGGELVVRAENPAQEAAVKWGRGGGRWSPLGGLPLHCFLGDSVSSPLFRREPQHSLSERVGPVVQGPVVSPLGGQTGHVPPGQSRGRFLLTVSPQRV